MPRRRKDQLPPQAAPGQAYGENQDQIQAQNVIPLPARGGEPTTPAGPPALGALGPPPGAAVAQPQVDPVQALLSAAQGMPPPPGGGLAAPSARPMEPLTAGMAGGAGPGREALGPSRARASTIQDTFQMLADLTGDPRYVRLASIAAQQGL